MLGLRRTEATAPGALRFADLWVRPPEVLDLTRLTANELAPLVQPFEAAFQAHMARGQSEAPGSRLPGGHARPSRDDRADENVAEPGADAGTERCASARCLAPRLHRTGPQPRQALPYRPRYQSPPKDRGPRPAHGCLRGATELSRASHALATDGVIGMNSMLDAPLSVRAREYRSALRRLGIPAKPSVVAIP
jgi:hypothetical protein